MTPAIATFILLGMANSFWIVCVAFFLLSFIFGLKDAPSCIYVSEIRYKMNKIAVKDAKLKFSYVSSHSSSEKSMRGVLLSFCTIAGSSGYFVSFLFGSFLSWRQLSLIISILPGIIIIAVYLVMKFIEIE